MAVCQNILIDVQILSSVTILHRLFLIYFYGVELRDEKGANCCDRCPVFNGIAVCFYARATWEVDDVLYVLYCCDIAGAHRGARLIL